MNQMNKAWQEWCDQRIGKVEGFVHPQAGTLYECWCGAWHAAKQNNAKSEMMDEKTKGNVAAAA